MDVASFLFKAETSGHTARSQTKLNITYFGKGPCHSCPIFATRILHSPGRDWVHTVLQRSTQESNRSELDSASKEVIYLAFSIKLTFLNKPLPNTAVIRTRNPNNPAAAEPLHRPKRHRHRQKRIWSKQL